MIYNKDAAIELINKTMHSKDFYQKIQKNRMLNVFLIIVCLCIAVILVVISLIFKTNGEAQIVLLSCAGGIIILSLIVSLIISIINSRSIKKYTLNRYKLWIMKYYVLCSEYIYDFSLCETTEQNCFTGLYQNQKFAMQITDKNVKITKSNGEIIDIDNTNLNLFNHEINFKKEKLAFSRSEMYSLCNRIVSKKLAEYIHEDISFVISKCYGNS